MKTSFTTLGCPAWDLDAVIAAGARLGFDGVDFRGLGDDLDITRLPAFTGDVAATARRFADAGLAVSGISSSLKVCDDTKGADNLEEARRTIPVALGLGCRTVRVFGGGDSGRHSKAELAIVGQETMRAVLDLPGADGLRWVFETHDEWIRAVDCALLLARVPAMAFGALWDLGHTTRVGGESPEESLAALGDRVGYVHVKDAVHEPAHPQAMKDGWRYVAPGTGQLPLAHALRLLAGRGYDGWAMFEHEKRWHPELEDPEAIFPRFLAWFRGLGL